MSDANREGGGPAGGEGRGAPGRRPPDPVILDELIRRSMNAQQLAYAPYSTFHVGATVLAGTEMHDGANIENASYGLTVCAERTAVAAAVLHGHKKLDGVAVCTSASPPSSPCGMCRQVLLEFARDPSTFVVIAVNPQGETRRWTLAELIPDGFSGAELP